MKLTCTFIFFRNINRKPHHIYTVSDISGGYNQLRHPKKETNDMPNLQALPTINKSNRQKHYSMHKQFAILNIFLR